MSSDTESSLPRAGYLPVCYRCAPAHAPRPAGTGKRSQRAECCSAPPPGPAPALASTSGPAQRGAALLCPTATVRAYRLQRAPGEAPGKREREGRGGQGRAGAAHTHSVRNSYGGDKAHGHTGAFRGYSGGPATPGPAASPPRARPVGPPWRARRRGVLRVLRFFRIPAARTRAEPEPDLPRTPAQPKRRALFSTC